MKAESSQKKLRAIKVAKSKLNESIVTSTATSEREKLQRFGIRRAFHVGRNGFTIRCRPNSRLFVLHKTTSLLPVDFETEYIESEARAQLSSRNPDTLF